MTEAIIQSLGFDYSINQLDFLITQVNLALLVSFIPHMQLRSLNKCQVLHILISPMDNQVGKFSREGK